MVIEKINFKDNKVFIGSIVGVLVLILLTVGATYAYFTFNADNQFGTQTIEATTEAIGSGVVLTKVGDGLTLDVSASEMLEENIGTNYYASGSEEPATIGKITVTGDGTYTCSYIMNVTATSTSEDKNLYTKFQSFANKSEGQIYLDINETRYDFNTSNLFPITYTNSVIVNSSAEKYITANMVIANTEIDQTILNDADISIAFEVTEFNCTYVDNSTKPIINSITKTSDEQESITISVNATSTNGIDKYYYSIDDGAYIESDTNTYTFNNLSAGTEHTISVYVTDIYGLSSEVSTETYSTKLTIAQICAGQEAGTCIQDNPPAGLDTTTAYGGMYRFVGTDVNNYVSVGGVSYRIIGITSEANSTLGLKTGQLKVIKTDSIGTYNWHTDRTTDTKWESSAMYTYLQGLNVLGSTSVVPSGWSDKIDSVKWYIGDVESYTNGSTVLDLENNTTTSSTSKIGLAYLSDWYYAYNSGGTQNCNSGPYCSSWMTISTTQWTMIRFDYDGSAYRAWGMRSSGVVTFWELDNTYAVRPVFYLTSDVHFVSGTGTSSDPFILE